MAQTLDHNRGCEIAPLTPEMYAKFWPEISRQLDTIPQHWAPWYTKEYLRQAFSYNMNVWVAGEPPNAEVIIYTNIIEYPSTRVFQIALIFGTDAERMFPLIEATFEHTAQILECEAFEVVGRRGWGRKLKDCKELGTIFRRPIKKQGVH